jgi:hypothetical protein
MLTWRSIPAVDDDDGYPISTAFVGAATVTINRLSPHRVRRLLAVVVIVAARAHRCDAVGPAHRREGVTHTS